MHVINLYFRFGLKTEEQNGGSKSGRKRLQSKRPQKRNQRHKNVKQ